MKLARYRTERGARRYAAEIERVWADRVKETRVRVMPDFSFGVEVKDQDGRRSWAAKRPRNFGRTA